MCLQVKVTGHPESTGLLSESQGSGPCRPFWAERASLWEGGGPSAARGGQRKQLLGGQHGAPQTKCVGGRLSNRWRCVSKPLHQREGNRESTGTEQVGRSPW